MKNGLLKIFIILAFSTIISAHSLDQITKAISDALGEKEVNTENITTLLGDVHVEKMHVSHYKVALDQLQFDNKTSGRFKSKGYLSTIKDFQKEILAANEPRFYAQYLNKNVYLNGGFICEGYLHVYNTKCTIYGDFLRQKVSQVTCRRVYIKNIFLKTVKPGTAHTPNCLDPWYIDGGLKPNLNLQNCCQKKTFTRIQNYDEMEMSKKIINSFAAKNTEENLLNKIKKDCPSFSESEEKMS